MTPREPEPSDLDRPSSRRDGRDGRERDRGEPSGRYASDEPTTGQHRIPDDRADYHDMSGAERPTGPGPNRGRPDGVPPAPRRRRGTPPTHGLPVPPPPITKELVSDDVPRRAPDLAPGGGPTGGQPVSPAAAPGSRPRHGDPDDETDRPREAGRHGAATSSHRAPEGPAERSGQFAGFRVPRPSETDAERRPGELGQPADDSRHDRHSRAEARPTSGGGTTDTALSDDHGRSGSPGRDSGASPDLRSFGGLRAGVARLGGARVGDALRQRGGSPTSGGPRRRFGGTGEQPTIEPSGRRDGPLNSDGATPSARGPIEAEKSGRDRRGFSGRRPSSAGASATGSPAAGSPTGAPVSGAPATAGPAGPAGGAGAAGGGRSTFRGRRESDDHTGGRPTHGSRRDRVDRRRAEPDDAGSRAVSEPTSQLPVVGPPTPGDRTTGAVRPAGPNGVPGGGPTGPRTPGSGPSGTRTPGGGPTGARMPGTGTTGSAESTVNAPSRAGGRASGPVRPDGRPGAPNPARSGGPTGPMPPAPGPLGPPGSVPPGGGPSRPIGRGPQGGAQRGGGPTGPTTPVGPPGPGVQGGAPGPGMPVSPPAAGPGGHHADPAGAVRPGPMGSPDTQPRENAGRAVAGMPPTGSAMSAAVVAPAPYGPGPQPAPATPRPLPPMSGAMPTAAMPVASGAPIGVPPSALSETAIVTLSPIGAESATADGRNSAGGREARYANQVHFRTSRSMIIAVLSVVVALIGVLPAALLLTEGSGNPDFAAIDRLHVPSWAASHPVDHTSGNQWCLSACLKSERTVSSTHSVAETASAYTTALRAAGWTPAPASACPPAVKGAPQSCWVLDREQMNVMVTESACAAPPPPTTEPGLVDPATPSTRASPPAGCAPTAVSISVFDRIDLRPATKTRG